VVGNNLTVNVDLSFSTSWTGTKNNYMYVADQAGLTSGWVTLGAWTVGSISQPPAAVSVVPSSGTGSAQTFSYTASSTKGSGYITAIYFFLNTANNGTGACYLTYNPAANLIYLLDDSGATWLPSAVIGTATSRSNSQCTLNVGSSSVTVAGNNLTVNVDLSFSTSWMGTKNNYMYVADQAGLTSDWVTLGAWTVSSISQPPTVVSVLPSSGSGTRQTFAYTASSTRGSGYITAIYFFLNAANNGTGACYLNYNPAANLIYLLDDSGAAWLPSAVIGTATSRSNSQCTLNVGSSSVTVAGNNLTVNVDLSFSTSWMGTKNNYMYVADQAGLISDWVAIGTWTP
jgi:hypothetical protein